MMEAIQLYDFSVIQGHRTKEQHAEYIKTGATKVSYENSKHSFNPSRAIDIAPYPIPKDWGKEWIDRVKFYELAAIVKGIAAKKGVPIRWGGDWDSDGDYSDQKFNDLVHFELKEV
jgi:hypothetical protein